MKKLFFLGSALAINSVFNEGKEMGCERWKDREVASMLRKELPEKTREDYGIELVQKKIERGL